MDKLTRKTLVHRLRAAYPPSHELRLAFEECVIAVETNSPELKENLAAYYGAFVAEAERVDMRIVVHEACVQALSLPFLVKAPEPGKTKVKEAFVDLPDGRVVRKELTGMVFVFGEGDHVAVGPCLDNSNQIVNFVNNRYIEWRLRHGCLLGHAAGVALGLRGLAIAGFSGMGKSTLALHLMGRGTSFVSNDRLIIDKTADGLMMHGVPKEPRINPGTALANPFLAGIIPAGERQRLSKLSEEALWHVECKYDAPIERCFGAGRFILKSPMDGLVILNWKRGDGPLIARRVVPAERKDLLSAFKKKKGLFYLGSTGTEAQDSSLETYAAFLADCTVIEMTGGADFEAATQICMAVLESGGVEVLPS